MEQNNFEKSILDFNDDITNLDIKIKPNYYIHMALIMAQRTLMISVLKTNVNEGITAYRILIEQIEMLCSAADYISDGYYESVKEIENSEEVKKLSDTSKIAKISNIKLKLLMKEVFGRSPSETPMSDKKEL